MRKFQKFFQKCLGRVRSVDPASRVAISRSRREDLSSLQDLALCSSESDHGPLLMFPHPPLPHSAIPPKPRPMAAWPFLKALYLLLFTLQSFAASESWAVAGFPWHPHLCLPSAQHPAFCVCISHLFSFQFEAVSHVRAPAVHSSKEPDRRGSVQWNVGAPRLWVQTSPVPLLAV